MGVAKRKIGADTVINTGNMGKGRPKGAKNKTTVIAKQAIEQAAEGLGGVQRMIEWAQESPDNEKVFWSSMYTKLIPVQTEVSGDMTISTKDQRDAAIAAALRANG